MPATQPSQAIGVFDSGVGGLTVVSALLRELPRESILYLGDTARLPYGDKSPRTISRYTRRNVDFLLQRGVKAVVVACNTASALALDGFEAPVPVWGVIEPGAEEAVAACDKADSRLGVIATESTVRSGAYERAIHRLRPDLEVLSQACALFVPLVEEGWSDDPIADTVARRYLAPLLAAEIDALVLGCTHYPILKDTLHRILGDGIQLVDSAAAIARRVARELKRRDLLAPGEDGDLRRHHLCVTDSGAHFQRVAHEILPDLTDAISLELVEV